MLFIEKMAPSMKNAKIGAKTCENNRNFHTLPIVLIKGLQSIFVVDILHNNESFKCKN